MKFTPKDYAELKADFQKIVDAFKLTSAMPLNVWGIYHRILEDHCYDDTHPSYQEGRKRICAFDGRSTSYWYHKGYEDVHINTALKKISNEIFLPVTK